MLLPMHPPPRSREFPRPSQSRLRAARARCTANRSTSASACALTIAACRETFEETGVLLASDAAGRALRQRSRGALAGASGARSPRSRNCFAELLRAEELFLRVERLVYWAHWITPSIVPRRFDTRFFLAPVPARSARRHRQHRNSRSRMDEPGRARRRSASASNMPVSHPTLYNLMELDASLQQHGSLQALLAAEATAKRRRDPAEDGPRRTNRNGAAVGPFLPEFRRRERAGASRVSGAAACAAAAHDRRREALNVRSDDAQCAVGCPHEKYGWIRFLSPVQ